MRSAVSTFTRLSMTSLATTAGYSQPVAKLLEIGYVGRNPTSYVRFFGFEPEHVPELVRMGTDRELFECGDRDIERAVVHAWNVLAELKAAEAVEPLVALLNDFPDDDWVNEDLTSALADLGPCALEPLRRAVLNPEWNGRARGAAASSLELLGRRHPDARDACAGILIDALKRHPENPPRLNSGLAGSLTMFKPPEAAPYIEAAFLSGNVEIDWWGWDEIAEAFGFELPPEDEETAGPDPAIAASPRVSGAARRPKPRQQRKKNKRKEKRRRG
jgi:hypothetical protein